MNIRIDDYVFITVRGVQTGFSHYGMSVAVPQKARKKLPCDWSYT